MRIKYYLNDEEVKKAVFRTFSSRCEKWLQIISGNQEELKLYSGDLKLVYDPSVNVVLPICDHSELIARLDMDVEPRQGKKYRDLFRIAS